MTWLAHAHRAFHKELQALPSRDRERVEAGLRALLRCLEDAGGLDVRRIHDSMTLAPVPDLVPLKGVRIPGSYRLRIGPYRVALLLLPDERLVLVTVLARREDSTYASLPRRHARRCARLAG